VPTFPVEVMPDWLGEWAEAQAEELQVPVDLPALLAIGLVGGGIARKVVVEVRDGFTEPTQHYIMCALPHEVFGQFTVVRCGGAAELWRSAAEVRGGSSNATSEPAKEHLGRHAGRRPRSGIAQPARSLSRG
jgi:hypothetical protein